MVKENKEYLKKEIRFWRRYAITLFIFFLVALGIGFYIEAEYSKLKNQPTETPRFIFEEIKMIDCDYAERLGYWCGEDVSTKIKEINGEKFSCNADCCVPFEVGK